MRSILGEPTALVSEGSENQMLAKPNPARTWRAGSVARLALPRGRPRASLPVVAGRPGRRRGLVQTPGCPLRCSRRPPGGRCPLGAPRSRNARRPARTGRAWPAGAGPGVVLRWFPHRAGDAPRRPAPPGRCGGTRPRATDGRLVRRLRWDLLGRRSAIGCSCWDSARPALVGAENPSSQVKYYRSWSRRRRLLWSGTCRRARRSSGRADVASDTEKVAWLKSISGLRDLASPSPAVAISRPAAAADKTTAVEIRVESRGASTQSSTSATVGDGEAFPRQLRSRL